MYLRKSNVEEAPLQSELMLYDPVSSQFFILNATMAHIWRVCSTSQSIESLVGAVREGFDGADGADLESDVRNAVSNLAELGLLVDSAAVSP